MHGLQVDDADVAYETWDHRRVQIQLQKIVVIQFENTNEDQQEMDDLMLFQKQTFLFVPNRFPETSIIYS